MKALLDTHILLWSLSRDPRLPLKAQDILLNEDNQLFYSVASIWEITIKHLSHPDRMLVNGSTLEKWCLMFGLQVLNITSPHVKMLETLSRPETAPAHNDPFDRIMLAQAKSENLLFITHDSLMSYYGESCVLSV